MTTRNSIDWLLRRIRGATTLPNLRQVRDDMGETFLAINEIKTALMVREKELTK